MTYTPTERAAVKEHQSCCSRRTFLQGGLLAAAVPAASLGAFYFGYQHVEGNPVRVAVLGTGDEGSVLIGALNPEYVQVKAIADIRPYNLYRAFYGDVDVPPRCGLNSIYGWKNDTEARRHVKVFGDYRDLLENYAELGIEAVIIALPLHLHAPATVAALRCGLHVLTEKLMGHTVTQCKEMAMAAKEANRHLATGHQRHYNILYHEAVENIKRGLIGDLHYIRAQWHRNNRPGSDSWQQPMPKTFKESDPLSTRLARELNNLKEELAAARGTQIEVVAKKVAQKQAQLDDVILAKGGEYFGAELGTPDDYGYESKQIVSGSKKYIRPAAEELLRWRLWERTGGGLMVELGSHQLDAASIFMAANNDYYLDSRNKDGERGTKIHPLKVHVSANRNLFELDREVNDHITALVEFPAPDYDSTTESGRKRKICVQYSTINGNGFGGYGEIVYGTKGTMILEREADLQLFKSSESATTVSAKSGAESALNTQASGPAQKAVAGGPKADVSRGYKEEIEHWSWCIRVNPNNSDKRLQPRCHPKVALGDAVIALGTNIAAAQGKSLTFREAWFDPENPATPETDVLADPNGKPDLGKKLYS